MIWEKLASIRTKTHLINLVSFCHISFNILLPHKFSVLFMIYIYIYIYIYPYKNKID